MYEFDESFVYNFIFYIEDLIIFIEKYNTYD